MGTTMAGFVGAAAKQLAQDLLEREKRVSLTGNVLADSALQSTKRNTVGC
jgi:uncharacterized protein (DUF1778 family)